MLPWRGTLPPRGSTKTTLTPHHADQRPATLEIRGVLRPAPAASGEHMVVKYYKKRSDGTWSKVDAERPVLSAANAQHMADTYAASKAVARVMCRTGASVS